MGVTSSGQRPVTVGLFIPCYINHFYPQVGIATTRLLQKAGCQVDYPANQTCCGQPLTNAGYARLTNENNDSFLHLFTRYDYVVAPSASCILHLKQHLHGKGAAQLKHRLFEICEFMTDILKINYLESSFPHRVALHPGCHGQRGLGLSGPSEISGQYYDKPAQLLRLVRDIELIIADRPDECCGFGGSFSITEAAVSVKMGKDRLSDFQRNGATYITSTDMSCLMHLEGILRRQGSAVQVIHIAEILQGIT